MLIGEAGVAAVLLEGKSLLIICIQGGMDDPDVGIESGAGQGWSSRDHLDEASLPHFGYTHWLRATLCVGIPETTGSKAARLLPVALLVNTMQNQLRTTLAWPRMAATALASWA